MADLLPILSKEEEEEVEDSPDTNRFRELPPPYSENEQVYAHSSKQVFGSGVTKRHQKFIFEYWFSSPEILFEYVVF